jgi:hypothetical protein
LGNSPYLSNRASFSQSESSTGKEIEIHSGEAMFSKLSGTYFLVILVTEVEKAKINNVFLLLALESYTMIIPMQKG